MQKNHRWKNSIYSVLVHKVQHSCRKCYRLQVITTTVLLVLLLVTIPRKNKHRFLLLLVIVINVKTTTAATTRTRTSTKQHHSVYRSIFYLFLPNEIVESKEIEWNRMECIEGIPFKYLFIIASVTSTKTKKIYILYVYFNGRCMN